MLSSPVIGGCSVQFTCYRGLQCSVHLLQGAAVLSSPVIGGCSALCGSWYTKHESSSAGILLNMRMCLTRSLVLLKITSETSLIVACVHRLPVMLLPV